MNEFHIGSIVILKSGGPAMTVYYVRPDDVDMVIEVEWFDGNELRKDAFSAFELVKVL